MIGPDLEELAYSLRFEFHAINNDVEYEAVIVGLNLAVRLGVIPVEICSDSQLIVGQVTGEFEASNGKMASYLMKVRDLQMGFTSFKITKVPHKDNERADALSRLASTNSKNLPSTANVQVLRQPSILLIEGAASSEPEKSWVDPLVDYLTENKLPNNAVEARRLKIRAASFTMIDEQLYK